MPTAHFHVPLSLVVTRPFLGACWWWLGFFLRWLVRPGPMFPKVYVLLQHAHCFVHEHDGMLGWLVVVLVSVFVAVAVAVVVVLVAVVVAVVVAA